MEEINLEKIVKVEEENLEKINKLNLSERKGLVKKELENKNLSTKELKELLLMDNTNEMLLCRYIQSLDDKVVAENAILKYSNFISPSKIRELKMTIFGDKKCCGFRNISYKEMFFEVLFALVSNEQEKFKAKIGIINISTKTNNINNQAFDTDNFEAFYYYLCILLKSRIELNKEHEEQYLSNLRHF